MLYRIFLIGAILCFSGLSAKQLTYADIKKTMHEMFYYHVEYKELEPQLVKRSFKIYMEQFDPDKMYLLKSDVTPYLELSKSRIKRVIELYNRNDFKDYLEVNSTISDSIKRSRDLRLGIEQDLIAGKELKMSQANQYTDYAKTSQELKERLAGRLYRMLKLDQRELSPETLKKALALWEKKLQRREQQYALFTKEGKKLPKREVEHLVTLHTLKAYARSLDAHTGYYSPDEAYEIRASLKKQLEGIGVVLREGLEGVYVADLIENGPAFQSGGVVVGDIIIQINGKTTADMSFDEVLAELKGTEGSRVELVLEREKTHYTVNLKREKIAMTDEIVSYESEPYAHGIIGKISLPGFYDNGGEINAERHLREALRDLKNQGELLGVVIDMRDNAGGFLTQAVKIAGMFITRGVIVISKYAEGEVQYMRNLDGKVYFDGPVVLLTSKASASAAEIVAGALQDYGVALVVGDERTYGKGSMQYQTITDNKADSFYKVTVGRYYTVSGKSTQIDGVPADIHVPSRYSPYNIGERYLEYPLSGDRLPAAYIDPLTGLDSKTQELLQKKYVPYVQKRNPKWRKMVSDLRRNSKNRIKNDPNFQCFLNVINGKSPACTLKNNFGVSDLQMREAVNIMRDMVEISVAQKSP